MDTNTTVPIIMDQTPANDSVDVLARDIDRLESLRAVKDIQRSYAQYALFGLWGDMADLFASSGYIAWGDDVIEGSASIRQWLTEHSAPVDTDPGALNVEFIDDPLINLSVDGEHAKCRWRGLAFRGNGKGRAWMEGGLYENEYVREDGRWKIAALRYYPQYEGSYEDGWSNVNQMELPIVPYHFTPDETGIPIPSPQSPAPACGSTLDELLGRVAAMNDEDDVRNLQSAYGYYVDRRMWDDVEDLFADDSIIEINGSLYKGKSGVREAMELMGPEDLAHGVFNDHPQFDTIVSVLPGGREAFTRGTELGMIGEADIGTAHWEFNIFHNRFVKEAGIWKIKELRITSIMKADYKEGWGKGGTTGTNKPQMPAMLKSNPATGKAVVAAGWTVVCEKPLTGDIAAAPASKAVDIDDVRRRYLRSLAWDCTENVSSAYGNYLDDFQWPLLSGIFAAKGNRQSAFAGYYFGRDRIEGALNATYGKTLDASGAKRTFIAMHWRIQPVINVSQDGRSALLRTRLFHVSTRSDKHNRTASVLSMGNIIMTGMYPNDQTVLEDGIWRLWALTIDEPYMVMPNWQGGWSAAKTPPPGGGMRASPLLQKYPPDLPLTELGRREEGFAGGTGTKIDWPGILHMWFHYRNPVSGRIPSRYCPDCVPAEIHPEVSMIRYGYQMPPTGPSIDGVEI